MERIEIEPAIYASLAADFAELERAGMEFMTRKQLAERTLNSHIDAAGFNPSLYLAELKMDTAGCFLSLTPKDQLTLGGK